MACPKIPDGCCLNITSTATPDPYFTHARGKFYLLFTGNDRVPMWEADDIMSFWEDGPKIGPVWRPPPGSHHAAHLWAPELHCLDGRWYIYYAAADPAKGNKSHRMYVLRGPPETDDPHAGPWEFLGPIKGMDQRQWAIDGTIFELAGMLYFVYSGWPLDRSWDDVREDVQQLFVLRLRDPVTAGSDPVLISKPDQSWERTGPVGINEGPQWAQSPDGQWKGLVYSCGASWTKHYKMATLRLHGNNPLDAGSWQKSDKPLIQNRDEVEGANQGPFGPGHGHFLELGGETVALFHATDHDTDGNRGRKCRMQKVVWTQGGPTIAGGCVGRAMRDIKESSTYCGADSVPR